MPGKMRLLLAWLGTYCEPSGRVMEGKAVPLAYTALPSVQSMASCSRHRLLEVNIAQSPREATRGPAI